VDQATEWDDFVKQITGAFHKGCPGK